MTIDCKRTLCGMLVLSGLMLTELASADAPTVGAPQFGPNARAAKPMVLVSEAPNPKSYGQIDLISSLMSDASDAEYAKTVARAQVAVRRAAPTLNVEESMREAFKCGAPESMCTELVAISELAPKQPVNDGVIAVLKAHQWTEARVLSVWWDRGGGLNTHAAIREVSLNDKSELTSGYPVLFGYAIPIPEDAGGPGADAWGSDPTVPKEATIRKSLAELEPLAQLALSWGANNDEKLHLSHVVDTAPMLRKVRKQGLQCKGMAHCNESVEGIVDTRLWTWRRLQIPMVRGSSPPQVWELLSRPQLPAM